jgi:hypothetical protein
MAKKNLWLGMLVMALAFGMTVVGCDNDPTDEDDSDLPKASGINAVSGKTYFGTVIKIVFSATADGTANGTYTGSVVDNGVYGNNDKFTYNTDIETGIYSWNEVAKTVTLKAEKTADNGYNYGGSFDERRVEHEIGPLMDKTTFRSHLQAMINSEKEEMGDAAFNKVLSEMGFSSTTAYIDYMVNEIFSQKTIGYSFSADGTALFLEEALPVNKGTNEFLGQTYYGLTWTGYEKVKDNDQKYVFTASGYTFTRNSETITGSYAYDSNRKLVWLRPSTINGQNRVTYYAAQTVYLGHHYHHANAYRSARTDEAFSFWTQSYNSTNKTIGWED